MLKLNRDCSTCKHWASNMDNGFCAKKMKFTEFDHKCDSYKFTLKLPQFGYNLKSRM